MENLVVIAVHLLWPLAPKTGEGAPSLANHSLVYVHMGALSFAFDMDAGFVRIRHSIPTVAMTVQSHGLDRSAASRSPSSPMGLQSYLRYC
ncbi:hypothetical protein NKI77_24875 [Mesorhizobium opportunistum]|uniref:Secreted protein n=1 Tax=Mesorhizobium opportunistum TaxID=593909 RepID=A0ABV1YJP2_9HYPH|nr:hypothetical protein [Mesorhizobium sp.]TIN98737.1 MAG: hypothetical protein E5Y06_02020 [Mesorhizobium sp.]TJU99327.1 MAG: hypothetical protein E5Y08_10705 [Mesorhizobium sp.]TJV19258.1 MAG: hypothetical protein E5Y07_04180 [Mesorhizobium sp.]